MNEYKVCVVIPAGRKRYMQLLISQILKQSHSWDELQIWKNTNVQEDIEYIDSLPSLHPNIRVIESPIKRRGDSWAGSTIYQFFKNCLDPNTVYIRFDDDVCYIDPFLIRRLAERRWSDKESFLVSPLVINNAVCTWLLQGNGLCSDMPAVSRNCVDDIGWKDPLFAERLHRWFLTGGYEQIRNLNHVYETNERYSINCISWLGSKFAEFGGVVGIDEETWLSQEYVQQNGLMNTIHTDLTCAHFAFFPQRDHMDRTDILQCYENFINNQ